jgi:hypothetical protein
MLFISKISILRQSNLKQAISHLKESKSDEIIYMSSIVLYKF